MPGHPHWTVDPVTSGSSAAPKSATPGLRPSPLGMQGIRLH
jgi:hypothetical protein